MSGKAEVEKIGEELGLLVEQVSLCNPGCSGSYVLVKQVHYCNPTSESYMKLHQVSGGGFSVVLKQKHEDREDDIVTR